MKKIFRTVLTGLLVSSFALTPVSTVSAKEVNKEGVSQIVAFGDSLSDNGQANAISTEILALPEVPEGAYEKPGDLYWRNRYSNGKTAIEVLADKMDVSLTNYATGGAQSGYTNVSPWMDTIAYTGMLGQVDKYEVSLNGEQADPNALHFILIGGNDYPGYESAINGAADQVVANIETAIRELAALGAKKFLISNAIELAIIPSEVREGRTEVAEMYSTRINNALPKVLKALEKDLDIDIADFDIAKTMRKVANNPDKYDIKYVSVEAQTTYPEVLPVKPNLEDYFFFDEWHFTAAGHSILAEAMYGVAKNIK